MKTKQQKSEEIERAAGFLKSSQIMVFTDFSKVPTEEIRKLRKELNKVGAKMLVMKKRLLGVLLKREGHEFDAKKYPGPVGTIFASEPLDKIAAPVFKFFKELSASPANLSGAKLEQEKILGGYDISIKGHLAASHVIAIGQLPPREVLLGQLVGLLTVPMRSLLFVLDQKSKKQ